MRGISMWEPWASLVAFDMKRFETRSWSTSYRGPLVIQAAKKWTGALKKIAADPVFSHCLKVGGGVELPSLDLAKTLGHLLCVVELVDVHKTENTNHLIDGMERQFGDYAPGRFAWEFREVRKLNPVPFKGSQGFFFVPDSVLRGKYSQ